MDYFSNNLRKKILDSYLKGSKVVVRLPDSPQKNHSCRLCSLELYSFEKSVWVLAKPFRLIHKGVSVDIPAGFCVCFGKEMNFASRLLLGKRFYRPLIVLVWFRDVLDYEEPDLIRIMDSVLIEEGFGKISRFLIIVSLNLNA